MLSSQPRSKTTLGRVIAPGVVILGGGAQEIFTAERIFLNSISGVKY